MTSAKHADVLAALRRVFLQNALGVPEGIVDGRVNIGVALVAVRWEVAGGPTDIYQTTGRLSRLRRAKAEPVAELARKGGRSRWAGDTKADSRT